MTRSTIDREALRFAPLAAIPAVGALVARKPKLALALSALPLYTTAFFRDPVRPVDRSYEPLDPRFIYAPADGRVMHVGPGEDDVAPDGDWTQITIFLSLLDVHINRSPCDGTVVASSYRPGKFLAAFTEASGTENERREITLQREVDGVEHTVIFRQVVGVLARRIVTRCDVGDDLAAGEKIGLMRFGSRMDVFLPAGMFHPHVRVDDHVRGGVSTLARWSHA